MAELIYRDESYKILGACFEVYKQKGFAFLEPVYQECLALEFEIQKIPYIAQPKVQIDYKGRLLDQYFNLDFICYDKIIVELKAVSKLIDNHRAQTINYLHATGLELAMLINFGHYPKIEHERFVNVRETSSISDEMQSWLD
jgi:GxxExxY protein